MGGAQIGTRSIGNLGMSNSYLIVFIAAEIVAKNPKFSPCCRICERRREGEATSGGDCFEEHYRVVSSTFSLRSKCKSK